MEIGTEKIFEYSLQRSPDKEIGKKWYEIKNSQEESTFGWIQLDLRIGNESSGKKKLKN